MKSEKPIFVMVLPSCRGRAIGDNAIRHAQAISTHFRPVIISDSFPDHIPPEVGPVFIHPPPFNWLRRFCHVPNEIGFAWEARKALMALEERERIAFVLCHGYTLAWFTGRWFRRRTGIRFGMFMHGHIFERPKGTYDSRVTAFYRKIAPICYRESDLLFALSPAQAELAVQAGALSERVIIAPNGLEPADIGIDINAVAQKIFAGRSNSPLRFLYVGRLNVEKGVDVFLKACAKLVADEVLFRVRLIGSGPERENLMRLAKRNGLDHSVIEFFGSVPRQELGFHYFQHDLLVVPSLSEPLGNVVLEGMSGGCFVIASETGGIPSMIKDNKTGILVKPGSEFQLYESMKKFCEMDDTNFEIMKNAFVWVLTKMSWERIGKVIIDSLDFTRNPINS